MSRDDDSRRPVPPGEKGPPPRIWLRFGEHDVELAQGETLIGRSPKCQLVLDDPLVSRTHVKLVVDPGSVTAEDLGSANGVTVNGERLAQRRLLSSGDRIVVGQQTFVVFARDPEAKIPRDRRLTARTLSGMKSVDPDARETDVDRSEATRKGDAFDLLVGVAEKVLALGRGDEAERILASYLRNLLQVARTRGEVDPVLAEKAATYAIRVAEATGKGNWVDYVFELYGVVKRPLPAASVERLYESLRKISPVSVTVYRQYLSVLRSVESDFGPAERFLMRRLEGLESLGALK